MSVLIVILRIVQLVSCLTAFALWKKLKDSIFSFFPFYLSFIVLMELLGRYLKTQNMKVANQALYNYVVIPVEFITFFILFFRASQKHRWVPLACIIVYLVCWLLEYIYLDTTRFWFYSFSYVTGNLLLLVLIFRFFFRLVFTNAILTFRENMLFWVSTGLLLFYLGTFPYFGLLNTLWRNYPGLCESYRYVVVMLNILMYLMFTFSFIWGRPNTKYS